AVQVALVDLEHRNAKGGSFDVMAVALPGFVREAEADGQIEWAGRPHAPAPADDGRSDGRALLAVKLPVIALDGSRQDLRQRNGLQLDRAGRIGVKRRGGNAQAEPEEAGEDDDDEEHDRDDLHDGHLRLAAADSVLVTGMARQPVVS